MVPFLVPNTPAQIRFNNAHKKTRVRVEQTFGQFKRRFFANAVGYRLALGRVPICVLASMVLYNISKDMNMPQITDDDMENEFGDRNGMVSVGEKYWKMRTMSPKHKEGF
jgi:hypothetical protein